MAEWSNAPDSKSGVLFRQYRGFESLSLRQSPLGHVALRGQSPPRLLGAFFMVRHDNASRLAVERTR